MSAEATALILGLTDAEQAEYAAAAHKTPAPEPEGEAGTGAGQTPAADVEGASASGSQTGRGAESARALGHEAGNETSGQPQAMRADTSPRWASVDDTTADLLTLVAEQHPATPSEADEWEHFLRLLRRYSQPSGFIDQNNVRDDLRGAIKPNRIGPFYRRAMLAGLIEPAGWVVSTDTAGKNSGRPCRVYRWLGGGDPDAR